MNLMARMCSRTLFMQLSPTRTLWTKTPNVKNLSNYKIILGKLNLNLPFRGLICKESNFWKLTSPLFASTLFLIKHKNIIPWKQHHVLCESASESNYKDKPKVFKEKSILLKWILKLFSLIRLILRAVRLFFTFTPLLLLYPLTYLSKWMKSLWWRLLLFAVEFSGPAFIKLGQWASTRRDLFSVEFCDRFSKLHHHAKSHSWSHTVKTLNKAYGEKWRKFLLFGNDAQPIGSGCIAQVYQGFLRVDKLDAQQFQEIKNKQDQESALETQEIFKDGVPIASMQTFKKQRCNTEENKKILLVNGPWMKPAEYDTESLIPVAMKVLHPGVRDTFSRDLTLMSVMANCIQFVFPSLRWLSLTECVEEFSISMKKQMNMRHEARCMDKLISCFSKNPNIQIPVPFHPLITQDVLVETFEDGEPISKYLLDRSDDREDIDVLRCRLAELGVNALLEMVFVNNFIHCDLHPGNILVQNAADFKQDTEDQLVVVNVGDTVITGVKRADCPVRLVFIDCGITATLGESDREKFREVFTSVVKGDGEAVAELFLTRTAHVECEDPEAFKREMSAVVMKARKETLSLSQIHVAELLSDVFRVLRTHHVKLESNFSTVILAIAVLEGLGRSLDPNLDILEKARPILIKETVFS